eukprot:g44083.t1
MYNLPYSSPSNIPQDPASHSSLRSFKTKLSRYTVTIILRLSCSTHVHLHVYLPFISTSGKDLSSETKKGKKSETPRMDDLASALEGVQFDPAPVPADPVPAEPNPAEPVPAEPVPADPVPAQAELEDDIPNGWRKFGDVGELFDQTDNSRFVGLPREFLRADKKVKFWGRKPAVFADEKDYFFAHIERNRLIEKPKHEFHFLVSVRDPDELIIFNSITAINRVLKARAYQINWIIPIGRYI